MPAIYNADCYCDSCANAIRERLELDATDAQLDDWRSGDEWRWDSDEYPKYMDDDEEADCPQHCGSGEDCLEAEVLSDGTKIGALLSTSLTTDGVEYVKDSVRRGGPCAEFWRSAFDWIDFPSGPTDSEIAEFTDAYLVALAFTATTERNGEIGEAPDAWTNPGGDIRDVVTADDVRAVLSAEDLAEVESDCAAFLADNRDDIGDDIERAGADFHLTRNRHGAGFWDGDWPDDAGRRLTYAAHTYGTQDLVVSEDPDTGEVTRGWLCH